MKFQVWGVEPSSPEKILLMVMPTREDAETAVAELEKAGDTELEIVEVEDGQ